MSSLLKVGPWGTTGSNSIINHDIEVVPLRLESITVNHDDVVYALGFSYKDREQQLHAAGPWGSRGVHGHDTTIELEPSEFITEIHGKYGSSYSDHNAIANLTFVTNRGQRHVPFGNVNTSGWDGFSVPVKNNSSIVGFFASTTGNRYLSAIGVYVRPF